MDSTGAPLGMIVPAARTLRPPRVSSSGGTAVDLADRPTYTLPARPIFRRNTPVRRIFGAALLVAAAACTKKLQAPTVQTATVARRDIIIDATANGVIEPIAIIEVKSKASGVITKMTVETGTHVNPGDLIVQIDTRDVQNRYDQAKAQLDAAQAKLTVAESDKKRNEEMYKARVITPQEYEQIAVNYESAKSGVVNANANLDLARQQLEDATVKAPAAGTVIDKSVSEGTVIASATGSVSGGTTIIHMADLGVVRIRALFNEADIGNVHPGEPANVTVDAFPDRRFGGVVEKIEPQAVVQQNVTMFPVLVNLQNGEGLLKPGMNGEVSVLIDERDQVLAIPNDAVKNPREAVATGAMLGLNADTVQAELKAQGFGGGNRGGGGGLRRGGGNGSVGAGNGGPGNGGPGSGGSGATGAAQASRGSAGGEVSITQQGQAGQQGGFGQAVSDADCKKVDDVLKAHPKEKKQLDDLRVKMTALRPAGFGGGNGAGGSAGGGGFNRGNRDRSAAGGNAGGTPGNRGSRDTSGATQRGGGQRGGSPEMQAISQQMRAIYTTLGLDPRTAGQCLRRQQGSQLAGANQRGGAGQTGGFSQSGGQPRGAGGGQVGRQGSALTPSPELGGRAPRVRPGLVYVSDSSKTIFHPRIVQLGQGNLDYTEVISALKDVEHVVMLGALALQAQRQQQQDRIRQNASPLGGQAPGPGGGGPRGGRGG
jgi:HlyD family secretion protein